MKNIIKNCLFIISFLFLSSSNVKSFEQDGYNNYDIVSRTKTLKDQLSFLDGTWYQVYSNLFVQESLEIDYHCVTTQITLDSQRTQALVEKKALQHFVFPIKNIYHYEIQIQNTTLNTLQENLVLTEMNAINNIIKKPLILKITGPVYTPLSIYEYFVLTNLSNEKQSVLYVLTWNYDRFINLYQKDVLRLLEQYNFTSISSLPLCSYCQECNSI